MNYNKTRINVGHPHDRWMEVLAPNYLNEFNPYLVVCTVGNCAIFFLYLKEYLFCLI